MIKLGIHIHWFGKLAEWQNPVAPYTSFVCRCGEEKRNGNMIPEQVKHQAKLELARRDFWSFEQLLYPELFTDERKLLKEMAETIQSFIEDSDKHYLVLSVPPRHFKSFTAKNYPYGLWVKTPAHE